MKKLLLFIFLFTTILCCESQQSSYYRYWIQFTDKNGSEYTLDNPSTYLSLKAILRRQKQNIKIDSTDLPVKQEYIDAVLSKGFAIVRSKSKWLNGITIALSDTSIIKKIAALPFVKRTEKTFNPNISKGNKLETKTFPKRKIINTNNGYGNAFTQINMLNGIWLHKAGYKGEGIVIAVLDGGFQNINTIPAFSQAWNNGQILGTKDFVNPQSDVFSENYHGEHVLSVMAAYDYDKFIGTAPEASYWLIRTENAASESPSEVDNMVAGLEFADSVGTDIITTSVGYYKFDNTQRNYKYSDLNGKTCRASIAETMASRKGIIVVTSAGNEGDSPWHYIVAPGDADSIITVGSVRTTLERSSFSGFGPTADKRIKPTVCALGSNTAVVNENGEVSSNNGTSLAAPVIAGLTACLWQAFPNISCNGIIELIKKHASKYDSPNNEIGYGIPDFYASYMDAIQLNKGLLTNDNLVQVQANKAQDTLNIETDRSVLGRDPELTLLSSNGKKILTQKISEVHTLLLLTDIKPGEYTLEVMLGDITLYKQKFAKQ
jgi:subtilisin family serine protease